MYLGRCGLGVMAEHTELKRLVRTPRRRMGILSPINKLERATKGLAKAHRIVPHYWKAAASFWPIKREGRNDCVASDLQGSLKAYDHGPL